jgi:hypothetical protein
MGRLKKALRPDIRERARLRKHKIVWIGKPCKENDLVGSKPLLSIVLLAVAFAWTRPVGAQDASSAKSFLESAFRQYSKNGPGVDSTGLKAKRYYHSSLIALMQADAKAAGPGNIGFLDGDPLCDCQDWDGIFSLKIDIQLESPTRAQAIVSFALFEGQDRDSSSVRKLKITLASERGQWRIYDIFNLSQSTTPGGLRSGLKKSTENLTRDSKRKPTQ